MKEITLDCSTYYHALESASLSLNTEPKTLINQILEIGKRLQSDCCFFEDIKDDFCDALISKYQNQITPFSHILWFHLTRTWKSNNFKDGILPRSLSKNLILPMICNLAGKNTPSLEKEIQASAPVIAGNTSTHDEKEGPCGILIREVAFYQNCNGNYSEQSKLIEDIFPDLKIRQGIKKLLDPCIVTSEANDNKTYWDSKDFCETEDYLAEVFYFIYRKS